MNQPPWSFGFDSQTEEGVPGKAHPVKKICSAMGTESALTGQWLPAAGGDGGMGC